MWDLINATEAEYESLPEDLTRGGIEGRPACWRVDSGIGAPQRSTGGLLDPYAWACTRPVDHTGRHAAGDGTKIRAVWR